MVFATGHDANGDTLPDWANLALKGTTVAVYMGRSVAARVAGRLIEAGLAASTPVAVIENASRRGRRAYAGRLDELETLADRPDSSAPVLFIIGSVVAHGAIEAEPAPLSALAA
jgi:uroporphyrin-III C-methyltransferase/precorrin-2 dehydrogenase/sirohydrochlorin ferrochelatase